MKRLLPILLTLSACSAPVPKAISDSHEADTGLVLEAVEIDGWTVVESCRPHLCHMHKRLMVTAPSGESLVLVVAPDESTGEPTAIAFHTNGWGERMPPAVEKKMLGMLAASKNGKQLKSIP